MHNYKELLLCNFQDHEYSKIPDDNELIKNLWNLNWENCLNNNKIQELINNLNDKSVIYDNYNIFLIAGIASLLAFVQDNFIGPQLKISLNDLIGINWPDNFDLKDQLKIDGEEINVNVKKPELLYLSKIIFENLRNVSKDENDYLLIWWQMRLLLIHQKILDDLSSTLYSDFMNIYESIMSNEEVKGKEHLSGILINEIIHGLLIFHRVNMAHELIERFKKTFDTDVNLDAMLGVRTKYQTKPLPQLILKVNFNTDCLEPSTQTHNTVPIPTLLKLDDDLRLEQIKFEDNSFIEDNNLPAIIQSFLLAYVNYLIHSQPKDKLADEELTPYLRLLLLQKNGPWSVRYKALLINIKYDSKHRRTVDRSLKQCEDLVKLIRENFNNKLSLIFTTDVIPIWLIEEQLADIMLSLGLTKTALDIYLSTQLWENVIVCYTILDLKHKAIDIIEQEIVKKPTVKLYCLLGDAKNDIQYYEKAWEISKETSGRAQRHWGNYYFSKKQYEYALPHYEKSLEINSLQEIVWLRLGYTGLMLEKWEIAAKAYRRYTNLEPNGFESWNNLAKAYIKLNDKPRAHKILQEALKCNFNNWRVWENYLLVSVDTGNFEDAINAYNRLIELKEKYLDKQVLEIIVNAVINDTVEATGRKSGRLMKKTLQLLGQLCVQISNDGYLWELSSRLSSNEPLICAQKLQKAYRCYTQIQSPWSRDLEQCIKVLKLCANLCESSLRACNNYADNEKNLVLSQLSSARLSAQACIKAASLEKHEQCNEIINVVQDLLEKTTNELKRMQEI